jgi:hypothetical protein
MIEKTYPYRAFVLTPGFHVKEVTIAGSYFYRDYEKSDKGKVYQPSQLHASPQEAIEAGFADLKRQEEALNKRLKTIMQRRVNLEREQAK